MKIMILLCRIRRTTRIFISPQIFFRWNLSHLEVLVMESGVYGNCFLSLVNRYSLAVRQEVFQKVERQYMLGLQSRDPEMRQKFFALYHDNISKTLFNRLQYIIQTQEWEALSDVFWLKQSLDLLLAILVEHEPITLAPNSAQVSSSVRHSADISSVLDEYENCMKVI